MQRIRRDFVFLAERIEDIFTPAAFLLNFNNFASKLFPPYTEVTRMETGFGSSIELLGSEFRGSASESDEIDFGGCNKECFFYQMMLKD